MMETELPPIEIGEDAVRQALLDGNYKTSKASTLEIAQLRMLQLHNSFAAMNDLSRQLSAIERKKGSSFAFGLTIGIWVGAAMIVGGVVGSRYFGVTP